MTGSDLYRRVLFVGLSRIQNGMLVVRTDSRESRFGHGTAADATVTVHDERFFRHAILRGHVGIADAFARRWWSTDDLTAVVQLFLRNRTVLDGLEGGWARVTNLVRSLIRALQPNTRPKSRHNIEAHYDLGNEFFSTFLDETLTYSCAYFEDSITSLGDASRAKYDRLIRKIDLREADSVLEIGSGWGGFAVHAARTVGCQVTTTTISPKQYAYVCDLIERENLGDRITVLNRDYRDLSGTFDKVVSIEMIEAIGHKQFPAFFEQCASRLAPDGMAAIQTITIQDRFYEQARREVDFIKTYIFPGSCIPSISALMTAICHTDLRLVHAEDIGPHYAETLKHWRENFTLNENVIADLGFDDWFRRLWVFYFCYCEGGFRDGALGNSQLVFAKPGAALATKQTTFERVLAPLS